jgi:hypothetical protein
MKPHELAVAALIVVIIAARWQMYRASWPFGTQAVCS